jgi:hypothetical protein
MIYGIDEFKEALTQYRHEGLKRGAYCGFPELHEYYSMKKGSTTYVVAPAAVGKSEFIKEIMINTAVFEDWNWVVFSPETGSPKEVFAELLWAYARRPIVKSDRFEPATDEEFEAAIEFVGKHFFVLDTGLYDLTPSVYFKEIDKLINDGHKIDGTVIDPTTELSVYNGGQRDIELGSFLTAIRKNSGVYNIHTVLIFHTRGMEYVKGKDENGNAIRYLPPPTIFDIAGGQQASRKGMFIIGLWRPPAGVIDPETGEPYKRNQLWVNIAKAKPKAIGKLGTLKFNYDGYSSRFTDGEGLPSRPLDDKLPF